MIQATPSLNFPKALTAAASKIFQFKGRSRRSEYWWTRLVVFAASVLLPILGGVLCVLTIPLVFRRLHDTGRSGWWWGGEALLVCVFLVVFVISGIQSDFENLVENSVILILFYIVAGVYEIIMLVWLCQDGGKTANRYGESPKYVDDGAAADDAAANADASL